MWIAGTDGYKASKAGALVNYHTTMGLAAVNRAVTLLSGMISTLPLDAYRSSPGGGLPVEIDPAPQLVRSPSTVVSQRVWRTQLAISWLLWGNAYGLVMTRDREGWPTTVEWLDPSTVRAEQSASFRRPTFYINGSAANPDDLLHIPGIHVRPGHAVAAAPLETMKETFGLALAARNFGSKWFGDGAHPSAILSTDQIINSEQATAMKSRFTAALGGRREPAVLGAGIQYTPIQTPANESQFLETQEAVTNDIARAFGLPVETIGGSSGSSLTYANREQRSIDLLTYSVDPWLVALENDVYRDNLPGPQFVKVNRDALLRTDTMTRFKVHDMAIRGGMATVNERRRLEDLPPMEGGDELLWPPYTTVPYEGELDLSAGDEGNEE